MVLVELDDVPHCGIVSFHVGNFLVHHVHVTDFAVGLPENNLVRVLFVLLDQGRESIGGVISFVDLFGL
jgi:hypothetical protein